VWPDADDSSSRISQSGRDFASSSLACSTLAMYFAAAADTGFGGTTGT